MLNVSPPPLPIVYVSNERFIYLGRSHIYLRDFHCGAAWLLVCLSGEVRFRLEGENHWTVARSILIPAGSKISIDNRDAVLSVCYLDAAKPDFILLRRCMQGVTQGVYFNHNCEDKLIGELLDLREDEPGFEEANRRIEGIIHRGENSSEYAVDERIQYVIRRLRETSSINVSVSELAEEIGMSESGLIKLFRMHIGAPVRKHRLWYRLIDFLELIVLGVSTNDAIKKVGFTDASHLSRSYSGLFGVTYSYAFAKDRKVKYILRDKVVRVSDVA